MPAALGFVLLFTVAKAPAPTFAEFPASVVFSGSPAQLQTPPHSLARRYRTLFRAEMTRGANFAGHYRLITWGCGTGCASSALVDLESGEAFQPPDLEVVFFPMPTADPDAAERYGFSHRATSNLLVLRGHPSRYPKVGTYFFVLEGRSLRRLRHFVWPTEAAG